MAAINFIGKNLRQTADFLTLTNYFRSQRICTLLILALAVDADDWLGV